MIEFVCNNIAYDKTTFHSHKENILEDIRKYLSTNKGLFDIELSDLDIRALAACRCLDSYYSIFDLDCDFAVNMDKKYIQGRVDNQKFFVDYESADKVDLAYIIIKEFSKLSDSN